MLGCGVVGWSDTIINYEQNVAMATMQSFSWNIQPSEEKHAWQTFDENAKRVSGRL